MVFDVGWEDGGVGGDRGIRSVVGERSHTGGIFGVSWHLGEGFELVRNPRVHLDGLTGE